MGSTGLPAVGGAHTYMTKRTVGTVFCCLAVVLFLSRYVIALGYRGAEPKIWSAEKFAAFLGYVGIAPWVFALGFLIAGVFSLIRSENEK